MSIPASILARLKALPFVTAITVDQSAQVAVVWTPAGSFELDVRIERSFLSSRRVDELVAAPGERPLLLLAPLVAGGSAARLESAGINFLDDAGNLHLRLGGHYMAQVEGKTLPSPPRPSGIRSAGYRVLFALMVRPTGLPRQSQTAIARQAGTSRTAVSSLLARLADEGHLIGKGKTRKLVLSDTLLQRWTVGYSDILRPALFVQRYRMPTGGLEVLERMVDALGADRFAWGGGVAARRLGGTFAGERVTLHVRDDGVELPLASAADGEVHLLGIPGPLAWYADNGVWNGKGVRATHPLLAYAELVDQRSDRALEAAAELRDEWLDLS